MQKMALPVEVFMDTNTADISSGDRDESMLSCDIHLNYQVVSPWYNVVRESRAWKYQYAEDGQKLAPPTFAIDTDDDIFNVLPTNKAFESLGVKSFDGRLLKDGERIWIRHPVSHNLELLWADGTNVDYAANREKLENFRQNLRDMEFITTSGENTKSYITREVPEIADKVHIFPNCIDLAEYYKVELMPHPQEIRILWQGSPTHWEDLIEIKDQLRRVMQKHDNVKLIIWGADYPWLYEGLPKHQVEVLPWMDYRCYKPRLNILNHDIAIAPLRKTEFANSRSAIKWYESAACWNPAVTLASNYAAFKLEMEDGKTGLLFDTPEDFETKLTALIEDSKLRKELAENAKDWMKTNRDPATHAMRLYEIYKNARDARLEWPEPKGKNGIPKANKRDVRKRKVKDRRVNGKRVAKRNAN